MRRGLALLLAAAALSGAACGGDDADRDTERLRAADAALAERPADPRALARAIDAAFRGAQNRVDPVSGVHRPEARPFLDRAAALWPRYVAATRGRPDGRVAGAMSVLLYDGLRRPRDAARAQRLAAEADPSGASYLRLAFLYTRAGDRRRAEVAGQTALELAEPGERGEVRSTLRELLRHGH